MRKKLDAVQYDLSLLKVENLNKINNSPEMFNGTFYGHSTHKEP